MKRIKMARAVSIILASVLLASSVTGCGGKESATSSSQTQITKKMSASETITAAINNTVNKSNIKADLFLITDTMFDKTAVDQMDLSKYPYLQLRENGISHADGVSILKYEYDGSPIVVYGDMIYESANIQEAIGTGEIETTMSELLMPEQYYKKYVSEGIVLKDDEFIHAGVKSPVADTIKRNKIAEYNSDYDTVKAVYDKNIDDFFDYGYTYREVLLRVPYRHFLTATTKLFDEYDEKNNDFVFVSELITGDDGRYYFDVYLNDFWEWYGKETNYKIPNEGMESWLKNPKQTKLSLEIILDGSYLSEFTIGYHIQGQYNQFFMKGMFHDIEKNAEYMEIINDYIAAADEGADIVEDTAWIDDYIEYLKANGNNDLTYHLIFMDDNDIPELVILDDLFYYHSETKIYSYPYGELKINDETKLGDLSGLKERAGTFSTIEGGAAWYVDTYYQLVDGRIKQIHELYTDTNQSPGTFKVDMIPVTEEQREAAGKEYDALYIDTAYNWENGYTYTELIKHLQENKITDKAAEEPMTDMFGNVIDWDVNRGPDGEERIPDADIAWAESRSAELRESQSESTVKESVQKTTETTGGLTWEVDFRGLACDVIMGKEVPDGYVDKGLLNTARDGWFSRGAIDGIVDYAYGSQEVRLVKIIYTYKDGSTKSSIYEFILEDAMMTNIKYVDELN